MTLIPMGIDSNTPGSHLTNDKEVGVAGVGTTKTGYIIHSKDQESTEKASASAERLQELGNETKLVKSRYGVVVHRFPTTGIAPSETMRL